MNIVDEGDVKMEPCEDDNFLIDHHDELPEEAHTFPPKKPKGLRNLLIVIVLLGIAGFGIALYVHFSSNSGSTSTSNSTSNETEIMANVGQDIDTKHIIPDDRVTSCLLHDKINEDIDPFIDKCTPGSQYVMDRCNNKSSHSCNDCCDDCKIKLPKECFCDIYLHCPENRDRPAKRKYNACLGEYCPCLNNGTCKDLPFQTATAKDIECFCQEGFSGRYCQYIPILICEEKSSTSKLPSIKKCSGNHDAKCYILQNNTIFICEIPQHKSQTHNITNCTNV
ncbi:uncharacterized protein LOC127730575 [Mytilus californianus]|uniref:uncharacterized protein LOC127730575 n=1 Tax=Mytilus californianus TaxID=6549 RepID=UPI002247D57C|nr:uncharacterized protein LOC127730575 [Mytilus californianus]XP_052094987.1 uncharacterized protein LOC127730575 [Mytilus californianus]XP_052094988.1 uncharacterized protein LOC127730575 [Mytilus californianus]